MESTPAWWRGHVPPLSTRRLGTEVQSGSIREFSLPPVQDGLGLRDLHVVAAVVEGAALSLNDVQLTVEWSEFRGCRFTQAVKPVLNDYGIAAQGSFGITPAIYRDCTFSRVRFKQLGGFMLGHATFENCEFVDCRWEGHFAHDAWLLNNIFVGKVTGCVWFGRGSDGVNRIEGNDFTRAMLTANTGFRDGFPVDAQTWPPGFQPTPEEAAPDQQIADD